MHMLVCGTATSGYPPQNPHWTLGMSLRYGPARVRFFMSKATLFVINNCPPFPLLHTD